MTSYEEENETVFPAELRYCLANVFYGLKLLQNKVKIKVFMKEAKVVWFLCFFSFKAIFKLNVVWQNIVQTLSLFFFYCVWCSNPELGINLCIVPHENKTLNLL